MPLDTKTFFNQFHVHTGEFNRDVYKLIDSAYRIKEKCDYSDFFPREQ